ncbi:diaminopimelate epimerase [Candidatus Rhabdochlamydia sp. T3358]|uniref:diaminopimelate epimerase n=1 Tax=Candidatus Rhabdochlamydia sp. T3358 TaxID=2099795 RepID=UPI0010B41347|nr:diaminopimelate epimerase [Candidatus Rhabdochlamydia sp. T3358]VHO04221.1 Diaminopimelate epimerase [Candidatus Rhabdochlamydia sp. T3358]
MIFTKYHGIGNDFILVDQRKSPIEERVFFAQIPRICDRHLGIGADGVLLLERSKLADLKMRIFNSDGSEADMCGNGIRCVADYEMAQEPIEIETRGGVFTCWRKEDQIGVDLKQPLISHWPMKIHEWNVYVVKVGVPHAVVFLPSFDQIDLIKTAREIRSAFSEGVNVNFASFLNDQYNQLVVRTYERGIENETISCGTGFAAVAFVVNKFHNPPQPILVASASDKISKQMEFCISASGNIQMLAEVCQVFSGSLVEA